MPNNSTKAPDLEVVLSDNTRHRLGEFWREGPLVLVLLRHLG